MTVLKKNQPFFLSGFLIVMLSGTLETNGMPDYRIQKADSYTNAIAICIF